VAYASAAGSSSGEPELSPSRTTPGFLLSYPGFPDEDVLRGYAEARLADQYVGADSLIAFFDRFPPLTNPGRAQYAIALMALRPDAALEPRAPRGAAGR
jgi:soluble lytic murein transglycosylase